MPTEAPLSCRDTTWLVSEARDRRLSAGEREGLHRHLATCAHCQLAAQQFRALFAQLDELFVRDASP